MSETTERLNFLWSRCGLSRADVARIAQIPKSTVNRVLDSKTEPTAPTIEKLCNAMGIHINFTPHSITDDRYGIHPHRRHQVTTGGLGSLEKAPRKRGRPPKRYPIQP